MTEDVMEMLARTRRKVLNAHVNDLTLDETVDVVEALIGRGEPVQHVVVNASKVNLMRDDARLAEIVNSCPLVNADGASVVWAAKLLGTPLKGRVTGIDLFLRLVKEAHRRGQGIYLFGAKEEVVREVERAFKEQYPGIRIVGRRNGYFSEEDVPGIVADMSASGADMLFVAFSSPKKEYWVADHLDELGVPFVMGVGGSFDVVAGVTGRAPKWMQDRGLEWLYRFVQEPGRLWRRYVVGNARFVAYTLGCKQRMKKGSK